MRVAYVASRYPAISHTFILREVEALLARGAEVRTFSIRAVDPSQVLSEADHRAVATTTPILPPRRVDLLRAAWTGLRHAGATAATVRHGLASAAPGLKAKLWQVFYVAEALLLFGHLRATGIRHVHAHFANVGADVARHCARFASLATGERWTWSFTMHGSTEFNNVDRFGLAAKVRDAELVVCISDFTRSQLQALVPAAHWDRMHVVHCGIDGTRFDPGGRAERDPGPGLHVLTVGRLDPVKGQPVLLEAARLLRDRGVDVHVSIVGDGPARGDLERITALLGIADHVTFVGAVGQDEIRAWYDKADLFCLPSFQEGIPVVLMEAMACELPVVSSWVMGIPELVEHGVSGALVQPGRADLLADAIADLAADPERRRAMGRAAREKVLAEFEIGANAARLAELLERVLG